MLTYKPVCRHKLAFSIPFTLRTGEYRSGGDLRCHRGKIIGTVERPEKAYEFTKLDLYPKIEVAKDEKDEKLDRLLDLSHRYCLVTQSVKSDVTIHPEIKRVQRIFRVRYYVTSECPSNLKKKG